MPDSKVKAIKYFRNISTEETKKEDWCIRGTSLKAKWELYTQNECCYRIENANMPHWSHASTATIKDLANQKEERDGFLIAIICSIGNLLSDLGTHLSINLKRLFEKIDALAEQSANLPTKEEQEELEKDNIQIRELLKLLCRKMGMSQDQIDNLRKKEYTVTSSHNV